VKTRKVSGGGVNYGTTATTYDDVGNATDVTQVELSRTVHTDYDDLRRTKLVTYPGNKTKQFFYTHTDQIWKTIDELHRQTVTLYDALGRPAEVIPPLVSAAVKKSYDANGNCIEVEDARGEITKSDYDACNRPRRVTRPAMAVLNPGDGNGPLGESR